jgi:hypothetical protein
MRNFSFEITFVSEEDEDLALDSAVMVELPANATVDAEQMAHLTKLIASAVGDFVRDTYKSHGVDATITVCT